MTNKSQAPSTKYQTNKSQIPSRVLGMGHWNFGNWNLFVIWILLFGILPLYTLGQSKISHNVLKAVAPALAGLKTDQQVALFVKGDKELIKAKVEQLGGQYKYGSGNIAAVKIPVSKIDELAQYNFVKYIDGGFAKVVPLNDVAIHNNNVYAIHQGYAPLLQAYDGQGVILGFVDMGIDFRHPDFKNADGTTRIKYLWDQRLSDSNLTPQPYGYGVEWTAQAIDSGLSGAHVDISLGHGSHVTGIAAGNGSAVNNYTGVAPKSDIIMVATNSAGLMTIVDGIDYIFKKADSLGKPCVINLSLGSYSGSRDGKDLVTQLINNFLEEKNGRVIVCAVGNEGREAFHLGYKVEPDSAFTWFPYVAAIGGFAYFNLWADTADFNNVYFAFGADNPSTYSFRGRTPYFNIQDRLGGYTLDTLYNGSNRIGIIQTYAELVGDAYHMEVLIIPDTTSYYWRFITKGNGRFDAWTLAPYYPGSGLHVVNSSLPDTTQLPDIARYRLPDSNQTMIGYWACSPKVITVGYYINRNQYIGVDGGLRTSSVIPGAIELSSSLGPTRDGRLKPDITATGNVILSTGALWVIQLQLIQPQNFNKIALGGMHNVNGGSSMASPNVAGVAALYLQKNPNANYQEVKDALLLTAKQDSFTTYTLNNRWGYGKLNGFDALTIELIYGCTDPAAYNYNPNVTMDDGSCEPVIFGCTDTAALNYDSLANTNDGSCVYVGIDERHYNTIVLLSYPNPFREKTVIYYRLPGYSNQQMAIGIYDVLGKEVKHFPLSPTSSSIEISNDGLNKGIYFYALVVDGKPVRMNKMILY